MKKSTANMMDLLDDDDDEHGDAALKVSPDMMSSTQHERFRARFRELANAMSQHPLADQLADSIDRLRRIADGEKTSDR